MILFTVIPAANMFIFSFQDRDQFGVNPEWVGLDNYKTIFTDTSYLSTFRSSLYYLAGSFAQQAIALFIAVLLCSKIKVANLFKGIIFFPYMMNGVAVSLIFRRFFQKGDGITNTEGTLNSIIQMFGGDPVKWLTFSYSSSTTYPVLSMRARSSTARASSVSIGVLVSRYFVRLLQLFLQFNLSAFTTTSTPQICICLQRSSALYRLPFTDLSVRMAQSGR